MLAFLSAVNKVTRRRKAEFGSHFEGPACLGGKHASWSERTLVMLSTHSESGGRER